METIKLQDKLQELLYEQRSYRYTYFGNEKRLELTETDIKKAMIAFAAYCCERQRESDAEAAETKTVNPGYMEMDVVDKSSILNNKLITDDYDN